MKKPTIIQPYGNVGGDGNFQVDSVTNHGKYSPQYSKFIINLHE